MCTGMCVSGASWFVPFRFFKDRCCVFFCNYAARVSLERRAYSYSMRDPDCIQRAFSLVAFSMHSSAAVESSTDRSLSALVRRIHLLQEGLANANSVLLLVLSVNYSGKATNILMSEAWASGRA